VEVSAVAKPFAGKTTGRIMVQTPQSSDRTSFEA
jgi:hypothetical protein